MSRTELVKILRTSGYDSRGKKPRRVPVAKPTRPTVPKPPPKPTPKPIPKIDDVF